MALQHGQRSLQLVCNIGKQFLPVLFIGSQFRGHLIEYPGQLAYFVPGFHGHFLLQVPLTDLFRRSGQLPEGPGDIPGQKIADHQAHAGKQEADPPQGLVIGFYKGPLCRSQHHPVMEAHASLHHAAHAPSVTAVNLHSLTGQGRRILQILEKMVFHLLIADIDHDQGTDQDQQERTDHDLAPHTVKMHTLILRIYNRCRTRSGCTGDFSYPARFCASGSGYGHR